MLIVNFWNYYKNGNRIGDYWFYLLNYYLVYKVKYFSFVILMNVECGDILVVFNCYDFLFMYVSRWFGIWNIRFSRWDSLRIKKIWSELWGI